MQSLQFGLKLQKACTVAALEVLDALLASSMVNMVYEIGFFFMSVPKCLQRAFGCCIKRATQSIMPENLKVGIIMDGNRRFARKYGMAIKDGHRLGYNQMLDTIKYLHEIKCHKVAFFAFGKKNYSRTEKEVGDIMELFEKGMKEMKADAAQSTEKQKSLSRLHIVGDLSSMPKHILPYVQDVNSAGLEDKSVYILFAYSSMEEYARTKTDGPVSVDLIIRPGNETRLSDFLLCSAAQKAVVSFLAVKWPMVTKLHLFAVLLKYRLEKSLQSLSLNASAVPCV
ncbi:ditrans,polycis-polyprenyl diphosphate synthase [Nematocida sp. AWRm77]|nr:ditrans,polycis-polyprenyl diphosphate synthase [Nematocida sp. AWRm77]